MRLRNYINRDSILLILVTITSLGLYNYFSLRLEGYALLFLFPIFITMTITAWLQLRDLREICRELIADADASHVITEQAIDLAEKMRDIAQDAMARNKKASASASETNELESQLNDLKKRLEILEQDNNSKANGRAGMSERAQGRPQDAINAWAIEQIRGNHDRSQVEKEYWQRRRERGDDVDSIADLRDTWKKNVLNKL